MDKYPLVNKCYSTKHCNRIKGMWLHKYNNKINFTKNNYSHKLINAMCIKTCILMMVVMLVCTFQHFKNVTCATYFLSWCPYLSGQRECSVILVDGQFSSEVVYTLCHSFILNVFIAYIVCNAFKLRSSLFFVMWMT